MIKIAILASGNGSNAEALIKKSRTLANVEIVDVITDNSEARVIQRCLTLDQVCTVIDKKKFETKLQHENEILHRLFSIQADWVFLCGYMRILSPHFLEAWRLFHKGAGQIVNIHPSLLPDLPGAHSIERAWEMGHSMSGVTLHFVDEGVDSGKILDQKHLKVDRLGTFEAFKAEMHLLEHKIYENFLVSLANGSPHTSHFFKEV